MLTSRLRPGALRYATRRCQASVKTLCRDRDRHGCDTVSPPVTPIHGTATWFGRGSSGPIPLAVRMVPTLLGCDNTQLHTGRKTVLLTVFRKEPHVEVVGEVAGSNEVVDTLVEIDDVAAGGAMTRARRSHLIK